MERSYLGKVYLKDRTERKLIKNPQKQKNFSSRLYQKERKKFFNNLNPSFMKDNNFFWKAFLLK